MQIESGDTTGHEQVSNYPQFPNPDYSNQRGWEVQQHLVGLLGSLDYVLGIRETVKDGPEDRAKVDFIVGLDRTVKDLVIPEVAVQSKASTTGVATFNRTVMKTLKKDGLERTVSREQWILEHRIVVLVGDLRISRSRKNRWPVTDEEIIASFESQLRKIDDYHRIKTSTEIL